MKSQEKKCEANVQFTHRQPKLAVWVLEYFIDSLTQRKLLPCGGLESLELAPSRTVT